MRINNLCLNFRRKIRLSLTELPVQLSYEIQEIFYIQFFREMSFSGKRVFQGNEFFRSILNAVSSIDGRFFHNVLFAILWTVNIFLMHHFPFIFNALSILEAVFERFPGIWNLLFGTVLCLFFYSVALGHNVRRIMAFALTQRIHLIKAIFTHWSENTVVYSW